ncbi:MAG: DUF1254 domain-containing protein [Acidimicrobiia bacterium]
MVDLSALDPATIWPSVNDALTFAVSCVTDDRDPLNEREAADGHNYVVRVLQAACESAQLTFDPTRPAFMAMLESVRFLGAAGPDIDYDVAIVEPGVRHRVSGRRGGATFVGICVYAYGGASGASEIVASTDVDTILGGDGTFAYEFEHPQAARVIVRQYFHDRGTQPRGEWTIERLDGVAATGPALAPLPTVPGVGARVANIAETLRWNLQLNRLWTPERRDHPNEFVRQTADDIVAAVSNPDVVYATSWWKIAESERLVIDFTPPGTRYWALQLCDRWFQCFPHRRTNLNDSQVTRNADGSVRIVVSDGDPGDSGENWLDTNGHRTGVLFFRWLHADPDVMPTCHVEPAG